MQRSPRRGFTLIEVLVVIAIIAVVIGLLLVISPLPGLCQGQPLRSKEFFKEANEKWQLYKETYLPKLQGSVRGSNSDGTINFHFEFENTARCSRYVAEANTPQGRRDEASASNSQYSFSIAKKNDRGWVLDKISLDPLSVVAPMGLPARGILYGRAAEQFMISGKIPLPELVNHSSFILRSVKNVTSPEGLALVHVDFGFTPYLDKQSKLYVPIAKGTMTLVPAQFWRVLECDVIEKYGDTEGQYKSSYEVVLQDNVPILKRALVTRRGSDGKGKSFEEKYTSECDLRFDETMREADFYLTAFGLPEPVGITAPPRSRWYLWLTLAAVASVASALLFRLLKRRFQAAEPVKN